MTSYTAKLVVIHAAMKNKKLTRSASLGAENPPKAGLLSPDPEEEPPGMSEDDIFQAELLPSYAKTYILPRKMRKWSLR